MRNIHKLYICNCSGLEKDVLKNLRHLTFLKIKYIEDISFSYINHLRNIRILKIHHYDKLIDEDLHLIKDLKFINELSISTCSNITDNGFKYANNIKTLKLAYCTKEVTDLCLLYMDKLNAVYLTWTKNITVAGLLNLKDINRISTKRCGNIRPLDFLMFEHIVYIYFVPCCTQEIDTETLDKLFNADNIRVDLEEW